MPERPTPHAGPLLLDLSKLTVPASAAQDSWSSRWRAAIAGIFSQIAIDRAWEAIQTGRVLTIEVQDGYIAAQVQDVRLQTQQQRIEVATLSDQEWELATVLLAERALFMAQLLNLHLPKDIEEALDEADISLFPRSQADFQLYCTCNASERACEHNAAVLLAIGECLDQDPFILLTLRGRDREQLTAALSDRRSGAPAHERAAGEQLPTVSAIELQAQRFWKMGDMSAMQIRIAAPEVEMESLKMLGAPEFAGDVSLLERLAPVYQRVTQRALELAYGNDETSAENGAVLIDQVEGTS